MVPDYKKVPSSQILIITIMEMCQRDTGGPSDAQIHETTSDVQIYEMMWAYKSAVS